MFTKVIGQIKQSIIHQVFEIYNKLFDHMEQARMRLARKRVSWKVELLDGIDSAKEKLKQYYFKTQGFLDFLYGQAALLLSTKKNTVFTGAN